ncbi:MAG TPA: YkvA family protein [Mycobacteriales bacterium]|nr:YkvA family protein [Mycobacteriales bacterium]
MDKESFRALAREAVAFGPDVARLFRDVARDERVPRRVKVEVGLAAGYLVMPFDVIPDFIPGIGQLDDVAIVAWAVRRLLLGAGEPVLREHWRGTDRGLEVLLQLASAGFRPRRLLAGLTLGLAGRSGPRHDDEPPRIVEGSIEPPAPRSEG